MAVVLAPGDYPTPEIASQLVSAENPATTVFYFMASEEFDPSIAPEGTVYRRVPTEVVLFER